MSSNLSRIRFFFLSFCFHVKRLFALKTHVKCENILFRARYDIFTWSPSSRHLDENVGASIFMGLGSEAKKIVKNVYNYFYREPASDQTAVIQQTVQATGVGLTTIYKIRREAKSSHF